MDGPVDARETPVDYELREALATEFAGVIKTIREEKWQAFSEAARQTGLDPYVALARMLVRMTDDIIGKHTGPEKNGS